MPLIMPFPTYALEKLIMEFCDSIAISNKEFCDKTHINIRNFVIFLPISFGIL